MAFIYVTQARFNHYRINRSGGQDCTDPDVTDATRLSLSDKPPEMHRLRRRRLCRRQPTLVVTR